MLSPYFGPGQDVEHFQALRKGEGASLGLGGGKLALGTPQPNSGSVSDAELHRGAPASFVKIPPGDFKAVGVTGGRGCRWTETGATST